MSTDAVSGVNLGDALRDGFVLSASESVALVYEICRQVDERLIKHVARRPADISITEDARVVSHATADDAEPAAAIASLLDTLLPSDAAAALKSLPSRLRDLDPARRASLKDLLAVLRYHLPDGPRVALHQLAARLSAPSTTPDEFAAEDDSTAIAAAPVVAAVSVPPRTTASASPRRRNRIALAPVAIALIVLSAIVGFYFTNRLDRRDAIVEQAAPASSPAPTPTPRVT